ncbi:hypothetical protein N9045_01485 [bacterium]|nr:hypothetical protein [bacterium]
MSIPKSKKLETEIENEAPAKEPLLPKTSKPVTGKIITIKPVDCFNDYVALLQTEIETSIELVGTDSQFKNEGIVIGRGTGMSDGQGGRLELSAQLGDYVMFGNSVVATLQPSDGHYQGRKVVIISERHLICKLPNNVEFEIAE